MGFGESRHARLPGIPTRHHQLLVCVVVGRGSLASSRLTSLRTTGSKNLRTVIQRCLVSGAKAERACITGSTWSYRHLNCVSHVSCSIGTHALRCRSKRQPLQRSYIRYHTCYAIRSKPPIARMEGYKYEQLLFSNAGAAARRDKRGETLRLDIRH